jgi:hypothetical protein
MTPAAGVAGDMVAHGEKGVLNFLFSKLFCGQFVRQSEQVLHLSASPILLGHFWTSYSI